MSESNPAFTTARRLETMTDRAKFEILARHVLRYATPDYAGLISVGVNANGETVVSPVDGYGQVPGSSPLHFFFFEATTYDADKLGHKWLFDHEHPPSESGRGKPRTKVPTEADDGDLLKAARVVEGLRTSHPDAVFTVILASNQRVDSVLNAEVQRVAKAKLVTVDIWEQTRIADFLDVNPTGQYLRWYYFGIAIERISSELLREAGKNSLRLLTARTRMSSNYTDWTERELDQRIYDSLVISPKKLHLLVGESGFGKTVAACQSMRRWLDNDNYVLWIDAAMVHNAGSIEEVINETLLKQYPTLAENPSAALREMIRTRSLLLVIDDINVESNPSFLLRRINSWVRTEPNSITGSCRIICPVWPRTFQAAIPTELQDTQQIFVGQYSPSEAERALGSVSGNALDIARELGYDPIAIGLYRLAGFAKDSQGHTNSRRIIQRFIDGRLDQIQGRNNVECLKPEHEDVIVRIATQCLRNRILQPTIAMIQSWLGNERVSRAFSEVFKHSSLTQFEGESLVYRHDRIRDYLLSIGMKKIISSGEVKDVLIDPYYADISAQALVDLGVPSGLVTFLKDQEPLVLAIALRYVIQGSVEEGRIVDALYSWVENMCRDAEKLPWTVEYTGDASIRCVHLSGNFNSWPPTLSDGGWPLSETGTPGHWRGTFRLPAGRYLYKFVMDESTWRHDEKNTLREPDGFGGWNSVGILSSDARMFSFAFRDWHSRNILTQLAQTDSEAVLKVTDKILDDEVVQLARARNGDVYSAIDFCMTELADPHVSFAERDAAFSSMRFNFSQKVNDLLVSIIPKLRRDEHRIAAIRLAWFIRVPQQISVATNCWQASENKSKVLPEALWVALSVGDDCAVQFLDTLLRYYTEISSGGNEESLEDVSYRVKQCLADASPHLSLTLIKYFAGLDTARSELRSIMWNVLDRTDHPLALEAITRLAADLKEKSRATAVTYWGTMLLGNYWNPTGRPLSKASLDHLQVLWNNKAESKSVRACAFRLWAGSAGTDRLEVLSRVATDDPLFKDVLWKRARLGDLSAVPFVADAFKDDVTWAHVAHHIWAPPLIDILDKHLSSLNKELSKISVQSSKMHDELSDLLMQIPPETARILLLKYWDNLRMSSAFLCAALATGGEDLEALVENAVSAWPPANRDRLNVIRFRLLADRAGEVSRVSTETFRRLLPLVQYMDESRAGHFAMECRRRGYGIWGRQHLAPVLPVKVRRTYFPSAQDLQEDFESLLRGDTHARDGYQWAEWVNQRSDGVINVLNVIESCLTNNSNDQAVEMAAQAISALGQRRGIEILARYIDKRKEHHRQLLEQVTFSVRRQSLS